MGSASQKQQVTALIQLELVAEFGVDAVRYNLLRNLSFASDGDFLRAGLIRHYNDELANDLGNLLNRVVSMIKRYRGGTIPAIGPVNPVDIDLQQVAAETLAHAATALDAWDIGNASIASGTSCARQINISKCANPGASRNVRNSKANSIPSCTRLRRQCA